MFPSAQFYRHPAAIVETAVIGQGTRIWAFARVLPGARVGAGCNLCDHTFIENDVVIGDRVTIDIRVLGYAPLMLAFAAFGDLTAPGLGIDGQYLCLSSQNIRNRPNFVVRSTQSCVPWESPHAGEEGYGTTIPN